MASAMMVMVWEREYANRRGEIEGKDAKEVGICSGGSDSAVSAWRRKERGRDRAVGKNERERGSGGSFRRGLIAPSPRRWEKREDVETVLSVMTKERERE